MNIFSSRLKMRACHHPQYDRATPTCPSLGTGWTWVSVAPVGGAAPSSPASSVAPSVSPSSLPRPETTTGAHQPQWPGLPADGIHPRGGAQRGSGGLKERGERLHEPDNYFRTESNGGGGNASASYDPIYIYFYILLLY